jgi:hypothetical protein
MAQEHTIVFGPFRLEPPPGHLGHGPERAEVCAVLGRYAPLWLAQLPGLVQELCGRQQAKALELRAALSLAWLWQGRGQPTAARQMIWLVHPGL